MLGVSAAFPSEGDACSGYLVHSEDTKILLDCGSGIMSRLPRFSSYDDVEAVLISHLHADHYLDVHILRYALAYSQHKKTPFKKVPLLMPPGDYARLANEASAERNKLDDVFQPASMSEKSKIRLGSFELSFSLMNHPLQSFAMKVSGRLGKTMVYSGDTGWTESLIEFAKDADLFLCEATLQEKDKERAFDAGHLTATQAGEIASRAKVKKLVLTHIWPEYEKHQSLLEASETFSGFIELAEVGGTVEV